MNKFTALSLLTSSALFLSACASNPTQTLAIQKADNQYEVTGLGKDQITAKNNAIVAANKTCGKKAAPVLINEKTEYHGSLNSVEIGRAHV